MRKLSVSLSTLALLTACGFKPTSGAYTMAGVQLAEDTCGLFEDEFDPQDMADEPMTITYNEDDKTVTVAIGGGEDAELSTWSCELDGKALLCTDNVDTNSENGLTLTQTFGMEGTFTEANALDFTVSITFDCAGENCAMTGITFPCSAKIAASAVGPA